MLICAFYARRVVTTSGGSTTFESRIKSRSFRSLQLISLSFSETEPGSVVAAPHGYVFSLRSRRDIHPVSNGRQGNYFGDVAHFSGLFDRWLGEPTEATHTNRNGREITVYRRRAPLLLATAAMLLGCMMQVALALGMYPLTTSLEAPWNAETTVWTSLPVHIYCIFRVTGAVQSYYAHRVHRCVCVSTLFCLHRHAHLPSLFCSVDIPSLIMILDSSSVMIADWRSWHARDRAERMHAAAERRVLQRAEAVRERSRLLRLRQIRGFGDGAHMGNAHHGRGGGGVGGAAGSVGERTEISFSVAALSNDGLRGRAGHLDPSAEGPVRVGVPLFGGGGGDGGGDEFW